MTDMFSNMVEGLATFGGTVPGIVHSYDPANAPEEIPNEVVPFALTVPVSFAFQTLAFQGTAPIVTLKATQVVYYMPSGAEPWYKAFTANVANGVSLPMGILSLAYYYLAQLKATPFLASLTSPPLPTHVAVAPSSPFGVSEFAGVEYHVLQFNYDLKIANFQ